MEKQIYFTMVFALCAIFGVATEASFVTKINSGFERVVVSIDDHLALSPTSSATTGLKGATHECQIVLEQIKDLISRTSDHLYKATKGQTYFRQVSLLLPSNWANTNCTGQDQEVSTATYQSSNSADISFTGDHPVYIDKPWTLQYGPCGVPGKKISVPVSFLSSSITDMELKARLMVRDWVKLRYGVFDENGFAHDEKYPAEFVGSKGKPVQATECRLNRSTAACGEAGEKCDQNLKHPKGKSLMSLPLDSNSVDEFCDVTTHVRTTPTKHNFLCNGLSVWEVMAQHEDFSEMNTLKQQQQNQNGGSSSAPLDKGHNHYETSTMASSTPMTIAAPAPIFSYVTAKSHRMIFLLDRSPEMNRTNRWNNLRRSLYGMFHHLPSGVELGVISYSNNSTISVPLTVASTHNRDALYGRIPFRPLNTESEESCISCAISAARKLIKASVESTGPTTLVLVSGSSSKIFHREWEKIKKLVDNTPLHVIVITYANMNESLGGQELIKLSQYGGFYKVPDSNNDVEQREILSNIFLGILNENVGTPLNKVYGAVHWPDDDWQARGKFTIEDSLGRNTWVMVTTEENGDVDGLQLISPTGREFDFPGHAEGLVYLRIPGLTEAGIWTYVVKFYQNQFPRQISVDVITESRKTESISVKFWNKVIKQEMQQAVDTNVAVSSASTSAEVVLLYTQVQQGELPVLNANVTAIITLPGTTQQHGPNTISVRLLDTGSSDPDLTWGDGIYSAYFTQLGPIPGFFSVSIQISDNNGQAVVPVHTNISRGNYDKPTCCGSSVPHIATIPTGSFSRTIAGSSFFVSQGVPMDAQGVPLDPYPPGRITDLRVEKQIDSTSEVKLSWTSPGGDYDKGKAFRYEIRCYTSRDALTNENFRTQGIQVHSSLTPTPELHGIRQSCTVSVPWANEYFYYGIVAVDNQNRGKVSNLVAVLIKETPMSTTKLSEAWEDDARVGNLTSSRSANKDDNMFNAGANWFRGLSEIELYFILAGGAAFLILISIFIIGLVCLKRRKSKSGEAPPAYHNIYNQGHAKNQSGPQPPKDPISCCWENDSNSTEPKHITVAPQKINGLSSPYITETKSYIPASALCAPIQNGSIYRDMVYAGSGSAQHMHTHDSSSVDSSKPSEGGSNETVHVSTDGHHTPALFYTPTHVPPPQRGLSNMNMNLSFEGEHNLHNQSHNNLSRDPLPTRVGEFLHPSDDDEGGFKSQRRNLDGFHKIVPMPSSEYDSPSIMNGSTYGGSVMSIPSSNKKRTRHISFV
ncbi:calcium-activated chloride channel regulator 1 [Folsomia candida]|uniref:calcium-activated chloride channel regulator 1 n=1 Tax=Folsomia candida TaxID=158441 RepID=UPI000B8F3ACC|nr:calcium-activated chloride channel regulator 1 [Folsomia candida]